MIFHNIMKSYSVRHYASADNTKVILGMKIGMFDEIKITLSVKRFKNILSQLNEINDSITPPQVESNKTKK